MKLFNNKGFEIIFNDGHYIVNKDISPIKEIIERKDISEFVFENIEKTPLSDTIQIHVNIIEVGQAIYFFRKDGFNKDSFIEDVSKLKEMPISSFYEVLNKVKALDEVSASYKPLFVIYSPSGKLRIFEDCFKTLTLNNLTIYASQKENNVTIIGETKEPIKHGDINLQKTKPDETKSEKVTKKIKLFNPIPIIKEEKYHFLFAILATFLSSFTLSIAIYDAYAGKMICIFFFICSIAGAFLNFMIYKDGLKYFELKSPQIIMTVISSIIGIGLGTGGYFIFKTLVKDVPAVEPKFILILAMMILVYLISSSISVLITYLKKRKK